MRVTMVKKRLENGEPCRKCVQAEAMLKDKGLWESIDDVVWALEGDAESPGMVLARQHGISVAPFFIVADGDREVVDTSVLQLMKRLRSVKGPPAPAGEGLAEAEVSALAARLAGTAPEETLAAGLERFGVGCAIAFSGAEDVILVDMAARSGKPFSVFCLDTGRLHAETYQFLEKVRDHYGVELHVVFPDLVQVQSLVREKGLFSFRDDGHGECCGIRKVEPLGRALSSYRAWVTGLRRDQSPATRGELPRAEFDDQHRGADGGALLKLNPLVDWSSERVWAYIRDHDVPYNALHERGFRSIGCAPCTRATLPGEHERAGRWWWEEATQRECGLHVR